jgi:hypothetical protein
VEATVDLECRAGDIRQKLSPLRLEGLLFTLKYGTLREESLLFGGDAGTSLVRFTRQGLGLRLTPSNLLVELNAVSGFNLQGPTEHLDLSPGRRFLAEVRDLAKPIFELFSPEKLFLLATVETTGILLHLLQTLPNGTELLLEPDGRVLDLSKTGVEFGDAGIELSNLAIQGLEFPKRIQH